MARVSRETLRSALVLIVLLALGHIGCKPMPRPNHPRPNIAGSGTLVLHASLKWQATNTNERMSVMIKGPGLVMGVNNLSRGAFEQFVQMNIVRYASPTQGQWASVSKNDVTLGVFTGVRWLQKESERISGHYVLRNDAACVYVELFEAGSEEILQEAEEILRSVRIEP
jgi:hypothetical protein